MLACFVIIILIFLIGFLIDKIMECKRLKISEQSEKERADFWVESYKKEIARKSTESIEVKRLTLIISTYKNENMMLKNRINLLSSMGKQSIPEGTMDAVRYAVKKSHPDNGGNADDFIRFKKCLDELSGQP